MKKNVLFLVSVAFAFLAGGTAFPQLYHIDFDSFPSDAVYRGQVQDFADVYRYASSWHAEWKFDVPKGEVSGVLKTTLAATEKAIAGQKTENVNLLLFRALIKHCLFNVDAGIGGAEIIAELSALAKKYPDDYRPVWLLGTHFADAADPFDAVREYERMVNDIFKGNVPTDVLADFCSISYMAMMFTACQLYTDAIVRAENIQEPRKAFPYYDDLRRHFKIPVPGAVIPKGELFNWLKREKGNGFLCRLFGVWLPVKDDWSATLFDATKESMGSFTASVPRRTANGKNITVDFSVVFQALPKNDLTSFSELIRQGVKNPVPLKDWKAKWPAETAFEFRDPALYQENGGGHGLLVFVKRAQPRVKGLGIEAPSQAPLNKKASGAVFYALPIEYTRFDGDIYYAFILDACEEAFEQSQAAFFEFLDGVLLD